MFSFIRSNYVRNTYHKKIENKNIHSINIDLGEETGQELNEFKTLRKSFIKNLITPVLKSFSKKHRFFENLSLVVRITFLNQETAEEKIYSYSYPQPKLNRTNIEKWFNALIYSYTPKGYKALFNITNVNFYFYERAKKGNTSKQSKEK